MSKGRLFKFLSDNWDLIALLLIICLTIPFYYITMYKDELVIGIDFPYYMIQVREILRSGFMKYGDPPLTFYILTLVAILVNDIKIGVLIGSIIFAVLAPLPLFLIIRKYVGSKVAALASLVLVYYSPSYLRMLGDFIKNQFGVLFIGLVLLFLLKDKHSLFDYILIFIFTLLVGLTHILDFVIVMVLLVVYVIIRKFLGREVWPVTIIIITISALCLAGYRLYPYYFGDINRIIGFTKEILSFEQEVVLTMSIMYTSALIIAVAGILLVIYGFIKGGLQSLEIPTLMTILLVILIFPWPSHWRFRLTLMTFLPISLISGYALALVKDKFICLLLSLLIISVPFNNALTLSQRMRPTITLVEYNDFIAMSNYISDKHNCTLIFRDGMKKYWVEYILDVEISKWMPIKNVKSENIYVILPNNLPPPHKSVILYHGVKYSLYKLIPKPFSL